MGVKNKRGEDYKEGTTEGGGRVRGEDKRREKEMRQKNEEGEGRQGSDGRQGRATGLGLSLSFIAPLYPSFCLSPANSAQRQALCCPGRICLAQT